jgi:phage baseplate assembly protein gpV
VAASSRQKAGDVGAGRFVAPGFVMQSQSEADAVAGALAERMGSAELVARGEAIGRPDVDVGKTISVDRVGTKLSGEYYVTAVEHVFGTGRPLLTRFTAGGLEPSSLVDLLGRGDQAASWSSVGVTVGVITNNEDPDRLGRVRVKFPSVSDSEESAWARVLTAGGGSAKGMQFVPDVNDEVLVVFEHGDPRRPYVLGAVWSDKQKPPFADYTKDGKSTSWSIGTPFGQSLAFRTGDAKDQRQFAVLMRDGKTKLLLGEDKVELFAGDQSPIEVKTGQASITLSGNGDVTIKGTNITLEATNGVTINGAKIDVKAKTALKAEGTATLELKAGASAKVEASGILELKGSLLKIN